MGFLLSADENDIRIYNGNFHQKIGTETVQNSVWFELCVQINSVASNSKQHKLTHLLWVWVCTICHSRG